MRKTLGTVIRAATPKTIAVRVDFGWKHPLYQKTVKRSKRFLVHDELGAHVGDVVSIVDSRPISRRKHWKVVEIVTKGGAK